MRAPLAMFVAIPLTFFSVGAQSGAPLQIQRATNDERRAVIFFTGSTHGTLEPCGCTSNPLGDFARLTGLVRRTAKEGQSVLLVDGGNLNYPAEELPARRREAADLRAGFLARELRKLPFGGSALGESDLSRGPERVQPKRLAANVRGAPFVEPSRLIDVGGIKFGVLGIADPAVVRALGFSAEDPAVAAQRETADLRKRGAEIVIALAPLDRPRARQIARAVAVDFVVLGHNVGDGMARPEAVGQSFIVAPAAELQKVGRIDIVLRGHSAKERVLVDAGGAEAARLARDGLEAHLAELELQLAAWEKDATADRTFVAGKRAERDRLQIEKAALSSGTWVPPKTGSYFVHELVPLRRAVPRDQTLASAMRSLDKAVGMVNMKMVQPPPKPDEGRASFVGDRACVPCHEPEMAFWKKTVHARAWKTLVVGAKDKHDECVSCHVTGYGEVGGSALGFTKKLESVQCESCHGPGSLHVTAEGLEEPPAVKLATPKSTCVRCHNEKHSDTFEYAAYLRDILGPGHGNNARRKLGPGPTGHELRSAATAKAKAAGQALKNRL